MRQISRLKPGPKTRTTKPAKPVKPVAKLKPTTQLKAAAPKPKPRHLKALGKGMGGHFRPWDEDRHPDFHVHANSRGQGYRVMLRWGKKHISEHFSPREFGSSEAAKFAALEFARGAVRELKGYKPRGWRLGIARAGTVRVNEKRKYVLARLAYNHEVFTRSVGFGPRSGRTPEQAVDEAQHALRGFRADLLRREKRGELGYDWFGSSH